MRRCPTCQSRYTMDARVCPLDGTPLEDAPDPLVGRTIGGRYLVCELIGTGGMGTVYRGRHQLVGRDVGGSFRSLPDERPQSNRLGRGYLPGCFAAHCLVSLRISGVMRTGLPGHWFRWSWSHVPRLSLPRSG